MIECNNVQFTKDTDLDNWRSAENQIQYSAFQQLIFKTARTDYPLVDECWMALFSQTDTKNKIIKS